MDIAEKEQLTELVEEGDKLAALDVLEPVSWYENIKKDLGGPCEGHQTVPAQVEVRRRGLRWEGYWMVYTRKKRITV
jgi:hypothetical protein